MKIGEDSEYVYFSLKFNAAMTDVDFVVNKGLNNYILLNLYEQTSITIAANTTDFIAIEVPDDHENIKSPWSSTYYSSIAF